METNMSYFIYLLHLKHLHAFLNKQLVVITYKYCHSNTLSIEIPLIKKIIIKLEYSISLFQSQFL